MKQLELLRSLHGGVALDVSGVFPHQSQRPRPVHRGLGCWVWKLGRILRLTVANDDITSCFISMFFWFIRRVLSGD